MHVSTPYLYLKRTIPTCEVTCLQVHLYLKNKGVITCRVTYFEATICVFCRQHFKYCQVSQTLESKGPSFQRNENQPSALPSFKGLLTRRSSFVYTYSCETTFSSC